MYQVWNICSHLPDLKYLLRCDRWDICPFLRDECSAWDLAIHQITPITSFSAHENLPAVEASFSFSIVSRLNQLPPRRNQLMRRTSPSRKRRRLSALFWQSLPFPGPGPYTSVGNLRNPPSASFFSFLWCHNNHGCDPRDDRRRRHDCICFNRHACIHQRQGRPGEQIWDYCENLENYFCALKQKTWNAGAELQMQNVNVLPRFFLSNFNNLLQIFVSNYVSNEKNLNTSDHLSSGVWQRMYKDGRAI